MDFVKSCQEEIIKKAIEQGKLFELFLKREDLKIKPEMVRKVLRKMRF